MIIRLELDNEKPLYQQLKEKIIYALAKGELLEGEMLPSVRQLSGSLAINMHTVNKAYAQLAEAGFLTIHKGKGVVVNSPDDYKASKANIKAINESIENISAEAKCRSIDKKEFIKMCEKAFDEFISGDNL